MNDWSARIKALEALGWSLKAIGEEVGLSTSSISDIKRGATAEPRGMSAVKLHELHASGLGPADAHRRRAAKIRGAAQADGVPVLTQEAADAAAAA